MEPKDKTMSETTTIKIQTLHAKKCKSGKKRVKVGKKKPKTEYKSLIHSGLIVLTGLCGKKANLFLFPFY